MSSKVPPQLDDVSKEWTPNVTPIQPSKVGAFSNTGTEQLKTTLDIHVQPRIDFKSCNYLDKDFVDQLLDAFDDNRLLWFVGATYSGLSLGDLYFTFTKFQELYPDHPRLGEIENAKSIIRKDQWNNYSISAKLYNFILTHDIIESSLQPSFKVEKRRRALQEAQEQMVKDAAKLAVDQENSRLAQGRALLDADVEYQKMKNQSISYFYEHTHVELNFDLISIIRHFGWQDLWNGKLDSILKDPSTSNVQILSLLPDVMKFDREFIDMILLIHNYWKIDNYRNHPQIVLDTEWITDLYAGILQHNLDFWRKNYDAMNRLFNDHERFNLFISSHIEEDFSLRNQTYEKYKSQYVSQSEKDFLHSLNFNAGSGEIDQELFLTAMLAETSSKEQVAKSYRWTNISKETTHRKRTIDLHDAIPAIRSWFHDTEKFAERYEYWQKDVTMDIQKIMVHYEIEFGTAFLIYKMEYLRHHHSEYFAPADNDEVRYFSEQQWYKHNFLIDELIVLRQYQAWYGSSINEYLRGTTNSNNNIARLLSDKLSSLIDKNTLQKEICLYRIVYGDAAILWKSLKEWDSYCDHGFTSTSFSARFPQKMLEKGYEGILLKITAPVGTPYVNMEEHFSGWRAEVKWAIVGTSMAHYTNQDEIVLQKNTTFEITKIYPNEQWTLVYEVKIVLPW